MPEAEILPLQGKVVFEDATERQDAIDRKLVKEEDTAVLGPDYMRVCRPSEEENLGKPMVFFLWTKDSADNNEPSPDKVVSFFCSF